MNNYQEILNYIKNIDLDPTADGYYQPKTVEHYYPDLIEAFQELVELATPKKPELHSNYRGYYYRCPTCQNDLGVYQDLTKHCDNCGQAIDRRKTDE